LKKENSLNTDKLLYDCLLAFMDVGLLESVQANLRIVELCKDSKKTINLQATIPTSDLGKIFEQYFGLFLLEASILCMKEVSNYPESFAQKLPLLQILKTSGIINIT
jgi:hypothetical protein